MKRVKNCVISEMLRKQKRHVSFHTPGHKREGADITELSYSDNLLSPNGVLAQAEADIAAVLGANRSFLLTDGSTSGVYSMLCAAREAGVKRVAASVYSHRSVKNGCKLLGLELHEISAGTEQGIPLQPTGEQIEKALGQAEALLLTSPDYYGNFSPLAVARELCEKANKLLLIDGAHGAHLHFTENYAGRYADMWVDGLHKSLPALTQGAVVSAKTAQWGELLSSSVRMFRTTSPSYPIMASCEYAVKYPRNEQIERAAELFKKQFNAVPNADWSKIVIPFGEYADAAQTYLEAHGVYPEFNDGNYIMCYLSPCTKRKELKKLARLIKKLPRGGVREAEEIRKGHGKPVERVLLREAVGRACAEECGLFPPCVPLIKEGELVTKEKCGRLEKAKHTFGLIEGKILVYTEEA